MCAQVIAGTIEDEQNFTALLETTPHSASTGRYITNTVTVTIAQYFNVTLADYRELSPPTILTFSSTQLVQCVDIPIVDDNIAEQTEVFFVVLSTNDTQVVISNSTNMDIAKIIIADNDGEIWIYLMHVKLITATGMLHNDCVKLHLPYFIGMDIHLLHC